MSLPELTPTTGSSAIVLPSNCTEVSGVPTKVAAACPIGAYTGSNAFLRGACSQVAYTYKKLGGDVLDIELTEQNIYANYEEACLEYSYIVNFHQAKNALGSALGTATGSFDSEGRIETGETGRATNYPKFRFDYAFRVGDTFATEAGVGGTERVYSASFAPNNEKQDYDLQSIIETESENDESMFYNKIGKKRVKIRQVYYVTPRQMWRFYGYYGGLNVTGDMSSYGQYADDSTFQVIPPWQNKAQAISYEDHLYTRTSHYSYEIIDNWLRLYPAPTNVSPEKFWVRFSVSNSDIWDDENAESGTDGVNNMNTLPFQNIPYENINSIGKQWIRRFGLALSKETLGLIRNKFGNNIPIPGDNITLNGSDLISSAKETMDKLREELKTMLAEMTYDKLIEADKGMVDNTMGIMEKAPLKIFVG